MLLRNVQQIILFDWRRPSDKETMLDALELIVQASDRVRYGDNKFGHLVIVLRDVHGAERDRAALDLGVMEDETAEDTFAGKKAVYARNVIRKHLRRAFQSVSVQSLPEPHPGTACKLAEVLIGGIDPSWRVGWRYSFHQEHYCIRPHFRSRWATVGDFTGKRR